MHAPPSASARRPISPLATARTGAVRVHRWLSLAAAAFWLVQAVTGVLIVFHWEMDDATIDAPHRATNLEAIDRRIAIEAPPGSARSVSSIWTSAGAPDRYDVYVDDAATGASRTLRVDGAGTVLREKGEDGLIDRLVLLHHNLLGGDVGSWIVGTSGALLLSNILMGLWIAWPRPRTWRQSLKPPRTGPKAARLYGWHRAIGLWAAVPAVLLVSAGVLLVFKEGVAQTLAAPAADAPAEPWRAEQPIHFSRAARAALRQHPGATIAGVSFPTPNDALWRIRLTAPGELARAYGTTTVLVSGNDGRVVADFPAVEAPPARAFVDSLFSVHTGEAGGTIGRIAVMALGLWLISMAVLGIRLWSVRRKHRRSVVRR